MSGSGQAVRAGWKFRARVVAVMAASAVLLVVLELTGWGALNEGVLLPLAGRLAVSVIVGSMAGIFVLYASPLVFPSEVDEETRILHAEYPPEDRLLTFNRLYTRIRWLGVAYYGLMAALAWQEGGYAFTAPARAFVLLFIVAGALNAGFMAALYRRCHSVRLTEAQIFLDILMVTVALHYSGGIENPVAFAYSVIVIIAAVLLDRLRCFFVAGVAFLSFAAVALGELTGSLAHSSFHLVAGEAAAAHEAFMPGQVFPTLGLHLLLLGCIAYLTTAVMERLHTEERHGLAVRQRSELIMQTTGVGFAIWDRDGKPDWLNPQMKEWLGVSPHAPVSTWPDLSDWTGGETGDIEKTYLDGSVRTGERQRADSAGAVQIYHVVTMPVVDGHGHIYEVVELVQRITERKRQASELARSAQLAALGVMAAGIAHEVNNPLASLSTRLRLLEEGHSPEFLRESVKLLQGQVLRIAQIVRSVTEFARAPRQEQSPCDLNALVSLSVDLLQLHEKRALCKIKMLLAPDLPPVNANGSQLQQVFLNLGLNAFEAMGDGGFLTVSTFAEANEVCVTFEDTGRGISEEDRPNIFNAFYSTKTRGLGLGLTVANDLVKSHGGRIDVAGSPGGGTIFTVALPRLPAQAGANY